MNPRQTETAVRPQIVKPDALLVPGLAALLAAVAVETHAFQAPDRPLLPNLDIRTGAADGKPTPAQFAAAAKLHHLIPLAKVDFDDITGSPKFITGGSGFLSGPTGVGKAVIGSSATLLASGTNGPIKAFVHRYRDLFGFSPAELDAAILQRNSTAAHNGVRTAIWNQQVSNIPVFQATLVAHTTRAGELISISSGFVPELETVLRKAGGRVSLVVGALPVQAVQAVALAAQSVGENTTADQLQVARAVTPGDAAQGQWFTGPGLNGGTKAALVWVPMGRSSLRLAWEVVLTSRSRAELFRVLVDAQRGTVLVRHCLTQYLTEATYRVYTNDSPSPFSPGWSSPNSTQPPLISRQLVTLPAINATASPEGWIPDGENETLGNNVDAHTDTDANDLADLPRPQGSPTRVFDFPIQLSTQDPSAYRPAAVVQLFYWNNWAHDKLHALGFDEAAGNFQGNNFGRGGLGGDAVQADAQDGAWTDNANFSTPPDGSPPRMQMFVWSKPNPKRDGDLDAEVILHEYTHGLSSRHVNGGTGLSTSQSLGLSEGWSDFYSLALLSQPGDDVHGCYAVGAYVGYQRGGPSDTQNYYFGLRRYPYCTALAKNPLTFNDIDPAQADHCTSGAPFHSSLFGACAGVQADEEHNQGEVWCMALWDARANLITRHGWAVGNQLILQLVTDGMLYAPSNPNFLQARDAVLLADVVNTGGANQAELWGAFAKRGMGFSATSPSSSTVSGVRESFDLPDALRIHPQPGFTASGPEGGPFDKTSGTFTLTNFGAAPFRWTATEHAEWLSLSPASGSLAPGGPVAGLQVTLNNAASLLPPGVYTANVLFTNTDSGVGQGRTFTLRVGQPDSLTEQFEANDNDLAYSTLTFTPDGTSSFYRVCRETAIGFLTDPSGGNRVILSDDSFAQVALSGAAVALYTNTSSIFFIGSNGYLTMKGGDETWTESLSAHFSRPRIAALFHDQLPLDNTVISWKQLPDRVAVTYQGLADILEQGLNDFQIEWFFDGRIRITYLGITNRQNLVGLSAGNGVPASYLEMDLSETGACTPIALLAPAHATEGDGVLVGAGRVTLPAARATNVVVELASSQTSEVLVPAYVIVPEGQTSATFDVTIVDDTHLDGTQRTAITAAAAGYRPGSQRITVDDNETAVLALRLPAAIAEGQTGVPVVLTVDAAPSLVTSISLNSTVPGTLVVPPQVFMPAGQTSAVFAVSAVDNFISNPPQEVRITAHVEHWTDAASTVTVLDNPAPVIYVSNLARIAVPDSGVANPYPSSITVSGVSGLVTRLTATVSNIAHTYPDDLGFLLVGPTGVSVVLMANAGGGTAIDGVTLTFEDSAPSQLPDNDLIRSGSYKTTPISPGSWPPPAPTLASAANLAAFNGTDPNGTWHFYVYDDSGGDNGRIDGGWQLTIHTAYSSPPSPVVSASFANPLIELRFQTLPAYVYEVEYAEEPFAANWLLLQSVLGDGGAKLVADNVGPSQRFYRIRVR